TTGPPSRRTITIRSCRGFGTDRDTNTSSSARESRSAPVRTSSTSGGFICNCCHIRSHPTTATECRDQPPPPEHNPHPRQPEPPHETDASPSPHAATRGNHQ